MDLKETGCGVWSGLIWLSTRTNGGLLCTQWRLRFLQNSGNLLPSFSRRTVFHGVRQIDRLTGRLTDRYMGR